MLDAIEKLLILQDRDHRMLKVEDELAHIPIERQQLQARLAATQARLDAANSHLKQLESDRKKLELEVDAQKQAIARYSLQQFQTKKNEEYRALTHEIDTCKDAIIKLEDQELEIMEQAELAQKEIAAHTQTAAEAKRVIDARLADIAAREDTLSKELADLKATRTAAASAVDESTRSRYERLFRHRGSSVIVGIQHGVCGGCHMQLSRQIVVSCQAEQEIMSCPNCGRILYYTPDMDLAVAE